MVRQIYIMKILLNFNSSCLVIYSKPLLHVWKEDRDSPWVKYKWYSIDQTIMTVCQISQNYFSINTYDPRIVICNAVTLSRFIKHHLKAKKLIKWIIRCHFQNDKSRQLWIWKARSWVSTSLANDKSLIFFSAQGNYKLA